MNTNNLLKTIKKYKFSIIIPIIFIIIIDYIYKNSYYKKHIFDDLLNPIIAIGTAIIGAFIWWEQQQEQQRENLPKYMTVHFKYNNQYLMTCYKVALSGESDLRQWAQQIGKQMNNNKLIDFHPFFDKKKTTIENDHHYYEVIFYLTKPLPENQYKFWWNNNSNNSYTNKEITCNVPIYTPFDEYINIYEKEGVDKFIEHYNRETKSNLEISNIKSVQTTQSVQTIQTTQPKILINLSNHPKSSWLPEQLDTALETYHKIIDLAFPNISPLDNKKDITNLALDYLNKIKNIIDKEGPAVVHIQGEFTFCFQMVQLLKNNNIKCIASTTQRHENKTFKFVQFREY